MSLTDYDLESFIQTYGRFLSDRNNYLFHKAVHISRKQNKDQIHTSLFSELLI